METPLAQVGHRHTGACVIGENKGRIVIGAELPLFFLQYYISTEVASLWFWLQRWVTLDNERCKKDSSGFIKWLVNILLPTAVKNPIPVPSMFGTFTYIWLIYMVHVGKYTSPVDLWDRVFGMPR